MIDYKKSNASQECITRNIQKFDIQTGNIYETVAVLSKRANQISSDLKEELMGKIAEYATVNTGDSLEEVYENREQIEIAKFYEHIQKPTLIATEEWIDEQVSFWEPAKENEII